ncbi:MAG: hypothetical protein EXS13_04395 [Planctomycetes bacterium]|nr:hypothetical protein [Planctomycetota bacterium]
MNEEAERGVAAATPARGRRGRLRPYVDAWLLSFFLAAALGVLWSLGEEAARNGNHPLGAFIAAPLLALLSAPALWLVRLFPEMSRSTGLRCVRRLLVGAICGLFPAALLAGLSVNTANPASYAGASALWIAGLLFGLIAGLVDALHLDCAAAAVEHRADELA